MPFLEIFRRGRLVKRQEIDPERSAAGLRVRLGKDVVHVRSDAPSIVDEWEAKIVQQPTESAATTAKPEPAPTLPGYELLDKIGEGGMGVVWKAIQLGTKRRVAIKFLGTRAFGSERSQRRFEREVELCAKLEHPNIARIYDSGLHHGVYYYAMELVHGLPLEDFAQQNKLDQQQSLELIRSVCLAVQHAHERGVIHRDLKPSNILVSADGQPHVLDFGLAKSILSQEGKKQATISTDGGVSGTPAYMSPEQAAGKQDQIDTRSDVYSLGVLLYRLLVKQAPHDLSGSYLEVMRRIVEQEITSPRENGVSLDRDLEAILFKALAQHPANRYSNAGDFAAEITNYLEGEALTARRRTPLYLLGKRIKRHRVPLAFVASLFAVALIFGVLPGGWLRRKTADVVATAPAAARVAPPEPATAPSAPPSASATGPPGLAASTRTVDATGAPEKAAAMSLPPQTAAQLNSLVADVSARMISLLSSRPATPPASVTISAPVPATQVTPPKPASIVAPPRPAIASATTQGLSQPAFTNSVGMKFVEIKPGSFLMGSPDGEPGHSDNEAQHKVTLTKGYFIGVTQVTVGQFSSFINETGYKTDAEKYGSASSFGPGNGVGADIKGTSWKNPGYNQTEDYPVVEVSWNDAQAFCDWLSHKEGKRYRLPTEAEWEYACRAGTATATPWGNDFHGPVVAGVVAAGQPVPVALGSPNVWGLKGMIGVAWQWCQDYGAPFTAEDATDPKGPSTGEKRIVKGSPWSNVGSLWCRSAKRFSNPPNFARFTIGFRAAADLATPAPNQASATPMVAPTASTQSGSPQSLPRSDFTNSVGMQFVEIKPGSFMMGSPESEPGRKANEIQHKVTLTKAFFMGTTHVTRKQFAAFALETGYRTDAEKEGFGRTMTGTAVGVSWRNPGFDQDDDHPVVQISWNDATAFSQWLSKKEGRRYRLPTEAEWEYAARAGTQTAYWWGDNPDDGVGCANLADRTAAQTFPSAKQVSTDGHIFNWSDGYTYTSPVGKFKPNAWGLYDMLGNAWIWCSDTYGPYPAGDATDPTGAGDWQIKVLRGGSWWGGPIERCAIRHSREANWRAWDFGFRLAMDADSVGPQLTTSPTQAATAGSALRKQIANSLGMELVQINPGTYLRGDAPQQHRVTLTKEYFIASTHVTVGQFSMFVKDTQFKTDAEKIGKAHDAADFRRFVDSMYWRNPGFTQTDNDPVVCVSWNDATAFCDWLSQKESRHYRLPTAAEWEYAARAGTQSRFWWGDNPDDGSGRANLADLTWKNQYPKGHPDRFNWSDGYANTSPVASFKPNGWGLYDMCGNAWQWCSDRDRLPEDGDLVDPQGGDQNDPDRVMLGSGWWAGPIDIQLSTTHRVPPEAVWNDLGFRVVMDADPVGAAPPRGSIAALLAALRRLKPDFDTNWGTTNERKISDDKPIDHGIRDSHFVIRGDGTWFWSRYAFDGAFVCQTRARGVANPGDRWGLTFHPIPYLKHNVSVLVDDGGKASIYQDFQHENVTGPLLGAYHFTPIPNQGQTLVVLFNGEQIQIAINGSSLGDPIKIDPAVGHGNIDTIECSNGPKHPGEAEFDWLKVWKAASLPGFFQPPRTPQSP